MGRTKDKGKGIAGSSSGDQGEQHKRRRMVMSQSSSESEEEAPIIIPEWKSGTLSEQKPQFREALFRQKLSLNKNRADGFVTEKEVREADFGPWGVIDKFKALGWEAALQCHDKLGSVLPIDDIEDWVATLRIEEDKKSAAGFKLIGTVGDVDVEMSVKTLKKLAPFDSKSSSRYTYPAVEDLFTHPDKHPSWEVMLNALFAVRTEDGKLYRKNLRIEPKLLLLVMQNNVIPRRAGDKRELRFYEIPTLYALLHGSPMVSLRYIIMNNIWLSRDSHERRYIPHCRLIAGLLRMHKVVDRQTPGIQKRYTPFSIKNLGGSWVFQESDRYFKLSCEGESWRVLKPDARSLAPGEEDEPEIQVVQPEPMEESEEEEQGQADVGASREGSRAGRRSRGGYLEHHFGENWAYGNNMQEIIMTARPNEYYHWTPALQVHFDHATRLAAMQEQAMKRSYDRQELWNRTHAYNFQQEVNFRYEDDRNRRMHEQWHSRQQVVGDPPVIDFSSLGEYDGTVNYPVPPLHHSPWVDPRQQQQDGDDQGAFNFGEMNEMMTSIFGPPQPRYYQ